MPGIRLSRIDWFFNDWFLGNVRGRLEPDQCCAYLEILWNCFRQEDGFYRGTLDDLVRFTRVPSDRLRPVLREFIEKQGKPPAFPEKADETMCFSHFSVLQYLQKLTKLREQKSRAGKKGGRPQVIVNKGSQKQVLSSASPRKFPRARAHPAPSSSPSFLSSKGVALDELPTTSTGGENQNPVASDQDLKTRTPGPADSGADATLWNGLGEMTAPGLARHRDYPWIAAKLYPLVQVGGKLRDRYVETFGRNPEDPPENWHMPRDVWLREEPCVSTGGDA